LARLRHDPAAAGLTPVNPGRAAPLQNGAGSPGVRAGAGPPGGARETPMPTARAAAALLAGLVLAAPAGPAAAGETATEAGRAAYMEDCAVCHGRDGTGEGPLAMFLKTAPTDLTALARENGGRFPFERAWRVIDGRVPVEGHGSSEMPVWGREYRAEALAEGRGGGFFGPVETEVIVAGRILQLIRYLEAIQAEGG
jgi:mono/diheme cytochrome c family protein